MIRGINLPISIVRFATLWIHFRGEYSSNDFSRTNKLFPVLLIYPGCCKCPHWISCNFHPSKYSRKFPMSLRFWCSNSLSAIPQSPRTGGRELHTRGYTFHSSFPFTSNSSSPPRRRWNENNSGSEYPRKAVATREFYSITLNHRRARHRFSRKGRKIKRVLFYLKENRIRGLRGSMKLSNVVSNRWIAIWRIFFF